MTFPLTLPFTFGGTDTATEPAVIIAIAAEDRTVDPHIVKEGLSMSFTKDPDAVLDYLQDWVRWLAPGDTIVDTEVTASDGITVGATSFTDTTTTVWLSGGTVGGTYRVTTHVTTAGGRQDDRSFIVRVRER